MSSPARGRATTLLGLLVLACVSGPPADRYRLTGSGSDWYVAGDDRVLDDVASRYPVFFEAVMDPARRGELDLRRIRDDLEHRPIDRRNFDALNSVAIAYFELNSRAEADRGGSSYLESSFQTAKLLAVPWRAYGDVGSDALRSSILDFFADAANGGKRSSAATASRLARVVGSLRRKEQSPELRSRIDAILASLQTQISDEGGGR